MIIDTYARIKSHMFAKVMRADRVFLVDFETYRFVHDGLVSFLS
jgi:hypothetical protein